MVAKSKPVGGSQSFSTEIRSVSVSSSTSRMKGARSSLNRWRLLRLFSLVFAETIRSSLACCAAAEVEALPPLLLPPALLFLRPRWLLLRASDPSFDFLLDKEYERDRVRVPRLLLVDFFSWLAVVVSTSSCSSSDFSVEEDDDEEEDADSEGLSKLLSSPSKPSEEDELEEDDEEEDEELDEDEEEELEERDRVANFPSVPAPVALVAS